MVRSKRDRCQLRSGRPAPDQPRGRSQARPRHAARRRGLQRPAPRPGHAVWRAEPARGGGLRRAAGRSRAGGGRIGSPATAGPSCAGAWAGWPLPCVSGASGWRTDEPRAEGLLRACLQLYPRRWRERYGDEVLALADDAEAGIGDVVDLALGGLRQRVHSCRRRWIHDPARQSVVGRALPASPRSCWPPRRPSSSGSTWQPGQRGLASGLRAGAPGAAARGVGHRPGAGGPRRDAVGLGRCSLRRHGARAGDAAAGWCRDRRLRGARRRGRSPTGSARTCSRRCARRSCS